jgi:hypothetical protein
MYIHICMYRCTCVNMNELEIIIKMFKTPPLEDDVVTMMIIPPNLSKYYTVMQYLLQL